MIGPRLLAGGRLRTEALYVKVGGATIADLIDLPMDELLVFFNNLKISEFDRTIGKRLLLEIRNRLRFMMEVGLSYLARLRVVCGRSAHVRTGRTE